MKGFERRQIKKSFTLPLLHLTSSIFLSVCPTFVLCLVLCCAGTTSVCSCDIAAGTEYPARLGVNKNSDQRFEAYIHANAILWKVMFHELCALTNTSRISDAGLGVNPM